MICKTSERMDTECCLPASATVPAGEYRKCPNCGTWYLNKKYGPCGPFWIVVYPNRVPRELL